MSSNGHYDRNLLAEAPAATKEQLQEGYRTDILPTSTAHNPTRDLEASKEHLSTVPSSYNNTHTHTQRVPFYRTKKGIILIVVAALVIIGAVVGGAVGGTQSNRNKKGEGEGEGEGESPFSTQQQEDSPFSTTAEQGQGLATESAGSGLGEALSSLGEVTAAATAAAPLTTEQQQQGDGEGGDGP